MQQAMRSRSLVKHPKVERAGDNRGTSSRARVGDREKRPCPPPGEIEIGGHELAWPRRDADVEAEASKNAQILSVEMDPLQNARVARLAKKADGRAHECRREAGSDLVKFLR